jgi:hypothetical protein
VPAACRRRRRGCCLSLDEGKGDVRLVVEDVVGTPGLAAGDQLSADDDPAFGKADFLTNLGMNVPTGFRDCRGYELGADVPLAQVFFVHAASFPGVPNCKPFQERGNRNGMRS